MLARWLAITLIVTLPVSALAATFAVNARDDRVDAVPGDGHCDADAATPGDQCTLRAAVQEANAGAGSDTIMLPAGTYRLTLAGPSEDAAASGDLDLTGNVSIVGAGSSTTVITAKKLGDRVFEIFGTAALSGIAVRRGTAPAQQDGGGFLVHGSLTLSDVVVSRCRTPADGGGIFATGGLLTLRNVMVTGNQAGHNSGGMEIDDGAGDLTSVVIARNGALNESGGLEVSAATVTLTQSKIRNNRAVTEAGGVENEDGGKVTMTSCQVTGNHAKAGAGITSENTAGFAPSITTLTGTTVTKNAGGDCLGIVLSSGRNHDSDGSCKF